MILSDISINTLLETKELIIDPIISKQIQPASVDLTLCDHFYFFDETKNHIVSMEKPMVYKKVKSKTILMPPKSFLLASTVERIKLPNNIAGFVEGRSSIGRLGLFIQNAGWIDPGFEGTLTLELFNANNLPFELKAGRRICQLVLSTMKNPSSKGYQGKYKGQKGVTSSLIFNDKDIK